MTETVTTPEPATAAPAAEPAPVDAKKEALKAFCKNLSLTAITARRVSKNGTMAGAMQAATSNRASKTQEVFSKMGFLNFGRKG